MDPSNSNNRSAPQKVEGPVKVVGFHVEGTSPSPRPDSLRDALKNGSLSPVIIPPAFQGQRGTPDTSPKKMDIPPHLSQINTIPVTNQSGALPLTPLAGTAPAAFTGELSATTTPSSPPSNDNAPSPESPLKNKPEDSLTSVPPPSIAQQKIVIPAAAITPPAQTPQQTSSATHQHQPPPKKELTRAERRAIQEAQRAAKAAAKSGGNNSGQQKKQQQLDQQSPSATASSTKLHKTSSSSSLGDKSHYSSTTGLNTTSTAPSAYGVTSQSTPASSASQPLTSQQQQQQHITSSGASQKQKQSKATELFAHLPQFKSTSIEKLAERAALSHIPIECMRLGLHMADGSLRGANARCAAMLDMLARVIEQFKVSQGASFARDFSMTLNGIVSFLVACRPLSPAMGTVVKAIKAELGRLNALPNISHSEAREELLAYVNAFAQEKIHFSRAALAKQAAEKIVHDGDVVMTYAHSSTVEAVLLAAADAGRQFSVVVVDARPLLEGRVLLRHLLAANIPCEYVLLNGLEIGLNTATKVVIGACAVMSNGAVLSRVGTAAVAMSAAASHIPVIVCAETYKFAERVQLDCITYNELGDPLQLIDGLGENGKKGEEEYSLLNVLYDSTPAEFVNVVMTEVGALPPTSVPVVLREFSSLFLGAGA